MKRSIFLALIGWGVLIFVAIPIIIVIPISLTDVGYMGFPQEELSLQWYQKIFSRPDWIESLWLSFRLGLTSSIISTPLGVLISLALNRYRPKFGDTLSVFFILPIMLPGAVLGISILVFLIKVGLYGSFWGLVGAHVILTVPFAVRFVSSGIAELDSRLENAAMSLGATKLKAFWKVTVPLLAPGITASYAFTFITSFDEVTVSIFLSTPKLNPIPVKLYTYLQEMADPLVASVSTIMIIIAMLILIIITRTVGIEKAFGVSGSEKQ